MSRLLLLGMVWLAATPAVAEEFVPPQGTATAAARVVLERMEQPVDWNFNEHPLKALIDVLEQDGISAAIDQRALDDVGIGTDTPITFRLHNVPLRAALKQLLRQVDLTWTVREGVVLITSPEEIESQLSVGIYNVSDLVGEPPDFDSLIELITATVSPNTWDEVGGPGSIQPFVKNDTAALVLSQTFQVHREIDELLWRLRQIDGTPLKELSHSEGQLSQPLAPRRSREARQYLSAPSWTRAAASR